MSIQKNAYVVMDTETSFRNGLVFDFGWTTMDKRGNVLGSADLNFLDVICKEKPYYINKIAGYARRQRKAVHKVTTFAVGQRLFNLHIQHLKTAGYRVILCAYNAVLIAAFWLAHLALLVAASFCGTRLNCSTFGAIGQRLPQNATLPQRQQAANFCQLLPRMFIVLKASNLILSKRIQRMRIPLSKLRFCKKFSSAKSGSKS